MRVLSDDVDSLCLVKECWELEEVIGTSYTESGRNANDVTSRDKDQLNILVDLCVYNVDLGVCIYVCEFSCTESTDLVNVW